MIVDSAVNIVDGVRASDISHSKPRSYRTCNPIGGSHDLT